MCRINKRGKIVYKVTETQLNRFVYNVCFYQKLKRVIISSQKIAKLNCDKFGPIVYSKSFQVLPINNTKRPNNYVVGYNNQRP
jgi:hypothetical protein